jgi:hypothetical protein
MSKRTTYGRQGEFEGGCQVYEAFRDDDGLNKVFLGVNTPDGLHFTTHDRGTWEEIFRAIRAEFHAAEIAQKRDKEVA